MTGLRLLEKWIRNRLSDEESKKIFDARFHYAHTLDKTAFLNDILPILRQYRVINFDMQDMLRQLGTRNIVLYGAGAYGRRNKIVLEFCGMQVLAFADSNPEKAGKTLDGIPVVAPEELREDRFRDALFVISMVKNQEAVLSRLLALGIPGERICIPRYVPGQIMAGRLMQYFDVFSPGTDEVFVDLGAYDGQTALDFHRWTGGAYRKIFCLEPQAAVQERLKTRTADLHDLLFLPYAAWSRKKTLHFQAEDAGSRASKRGTPVPAMPLDRLIDEPVTFIKMDIEGSERQALHGAKKLIRTYKPRLAVCIYHRRWDVIILPLYVLWLVPDYRLTIRQYSASIYETVLLAEVPEEKKRRKNPP